MLKYLNSYVEFVKSHPIDGEEDFKETGFEKAEELRLLHNFAKWPSCIYELAEVADLTILDYHLTVEERKFWLPHLQKINPAIEDIFILGTYLHDDLMYLPCGKDENPAVYFFNFEKHIQHVPSLCDYLIAKRNGLYKTFQKELAGRLELRERVEQAKTILKPLYETANALIVPYLGEGQEKKIFRMVAHWLPRLHKEIFYNPYQLRYHSDYSKWEVEALKYNNLVREYLALTLPAFEKENLPLALRVAELGRQFVNFEQTIRWVAAAPDATVKKPSPAAQDAAKEERDITDFLL